jgi:hypothetical protein
LSAYTRQTRHSSIAGAGGAAGAPPAADFLPSMMPFAPRTGASGRGER